MVSLPAPPPLHSPFPLLSSLPSYMYAPAYERFKDSVKIVHFIGAQKPWKGMPQPGQGVWCCGVAELRSLLSVLTRSPLPQACTS